MLDTTEDAYRAPADARRVAGRSAATRGERSSASGATRRWPRRSRPTGMTRSTATPSEAGAAPRVHAATIAADAATAGMTALRFAIDDTTGMPRRACPSAARVGFASP